MTPVLLHDYSAIPPKHKEACERLQNEIDRCPDCALVLNADRDSVEESGKAPRLFKNYQGGYMTQEYVGVAVDSGGTTFLINSRFDTGGKQYFLQFLFEKAYRVNHRIFRNMEPSASPARMFELLLMLTFIVRFRRAAGKGLFRQYRKFDRNDANVRGTIDFARHIRENTLSAAGSNGRISCSVREFTVSNDVNVLILQALDRMKRKYPNVVKQYVNDREVRAALQRLTRSNPDWREVGTSSLLQRTNRRIVHTVYREYETLRRTARLILRRMGLNVLDASGCKTMGVLLNVSKLWEAYIETCILSNLPREIRVKAQAGYEILNGRYALTPDFVLEKDGKKVALDAKYVRAWQNSYQGGWENCRDNLFQVMAYMYALDCVAGGVVFPFRLPRDIDGAPPDIDGASPFPDGDARRRIFSRIPVVIPRYDDTTPYEAFSQRMNRQNIRLSQGICKLWDI